MSHDNPVALEKISKIDIEPIARCNLRCGFCQVPGWSRAEYTRPMTLELFSRVIDQLPGLKQVKLQGMGEPFLNRQLPEMISAARRKAIKTIVVTNGTILTPELIQKVIDTDLSVLKFSVDGATRHTYESQRKPAQFERVIENIKTTSALRNKNKSALQIQIITLPSNQEVLAEIPLLIELAAEIGVDKVSIKRRVKLWEQKDSTGSYAFSPSYINQYREFDVIMKRSFKAGKQRGVKVTLKDDPVYSSRKQCKWPFREMYITTEGKVVPCCVVAMPETWCMGDAAQDTLQNIWNNQNYRALREQLIDNRIPDTCRGCYERSAGKPSSHFNKMHALWQHITGMNARSKSM